jgi:hypothetical protein
MNKVIEVDFLPRETDVAFSWLNSIGDFALRRILIVDNDKNTTHLVTILLEKTGRYLVFEGNDSTRAHQTARRTFACARESLRLSGAFVIRDSLNRKSDPIQRFNALTI